MCGRADGVNSVLFSPHLVASESSAGEMMYARHLADTNALGEGGGEGLHVWGGKNAPGQERQTFRTSELDTESDMVGCLVTPIQVCDQGLNVNKSEPSW